MSISSLPITTSYDCRRCIDKEINSEDSLSSSEKSEYSRMKYGHIDATEKIAKSLLTKLLHEPFVSEILHQNSELYISSAAYGSVPTASHALMVEIVRGLTLRGFNVKTFKIDREGSFHQANYGTLDRDSRQDSIRSRYIYLPNHVERLIANKKLIIIDDLRATGTHETALRNLLINHTNPKNILFAYPVGFDDKLASHYPSFEATLNDAQIGSLDDLNNLYLEVDMPLIVNARLIKFIFFQGGKDKRALESLLRSFSNDYCFSLYRAAISSDGYYAFDDYQTGFEVLKKHLRNFSPANI